MKRYIFRTSAKQLDNNEGWEKTYSISLEKPNGKETKLKEVSEKIDRKYLHYTASIEFKGDKEALEWFDANHKKY